MQRKSLLRLNDTADVKAVRLSLSTGETLPVKSPVAVETPINMLINGEKIATLFASPSMTEELAVGNILGDGIIKSVTDIEEIKSRGNEVDIRTKTSVKMRIHAAKTIKIVETSCGSTEDFYRLLDRLDKPVVKSNHRISTDDARMMTRELNARARLFKRGCAVHAAAIFEDDKMVAFCEDVGRHNATDKVIGATALANMDFNKCALIGTGRQPASMIMKVARVGIPISLSIRGPIHSGIHVALKTGVTLACFGRTPGLTVYSFPERIIPTPKIRVVQPQPP